MNIGNLFKAFSVGKSLASGEGASGVVSDMAMFKHSRKLEKMLMTSASAYSSGYSSSNMADMGRLAIIGATTGLVWLIVSYVTSRPYTEEGSEKVKVDPFSPIKASGAAIVAMLATFHLMGTLRQHGNFMLFSGTSLLLQQGMIVGGTLSTSFVLLKLASTLDAKGSALVSSLLSVAALIISRKTYMKFKLNDIEKTVFSELADIIEQCKDNACDHKHAGYMEVYANSIAPFIERMSRFLPEPLDPVKIARHIASKQNLDTAKAFF